MVDESVGKEASEDSGIRKKVLMSDGESVFEWREIFDLDAHNLEVFVPDDQHGVGLRSEIDVRKSAFFDVAAMLFLIKDHCNLEGGLYLAESNEGFTANCHKDTLISMRIEHTMKVDI